MARTQQWRYLKVTIESAFTSYFLRNVSCVRPVATGRDIQGQCRANFAVPRKIYFKKHKIKKFLSPYKFFCLPINLKSGCGSVMSRATIIFT